MRMEHTNFQFRTNIDHSSCVTIVTPFLNYTKGVSYWEMDSAKGEKILTIKSQGISRQGVIEAVQRAGFKIESII